MSEDDSFFYLHASGKRLPSTSSPRTSMNPKVCKLSKQLIITYQATKVIEVGNKRAQSGPGTLPDFKFS